MDKGIVKTALTAEQLRQAIKDKTTTKVFVYVAITKDGGCSLRVSKAAALDLIAPLSDDTVTTSEHADGRVWIG